MTEILTQKVGRRNVYSRTDVDLEGNILLKKTANFRLKAIKSEKENFVYYDIIKNDGTSILQAFGFLNFRLRALRCSDNTRKKYAYTLIKLYSFLFLMDYELSTLTSDGVHQLVNFLQEKGEGSCNESVNFALANIRSYLIFNNIENQTLFAKHLVEQSECDTENIRFISTQYKYDINLKNSPDRMREVPKYISEDEYKRLITIAQDKKDWVAVMLIHLMFRYGMRRGECLGLTEEDITVMSVEGVKMPTVILRNRISDNPDQKAKIKMTPVSKDDYKNPSYINSWQKDPYSHYYLNESEEFFPTFLNFIQKMKERGEAHPKNYRSAEADITTDDFKGINHYIFLNKIGRRLTGENWNKTLRKYFIAAGIPVDTGKKRTNLSHRLRHGFAMMHAPHMAPAELKELMHHSSITTTMVYYTPTKKDKLDHITALENDIYKDCPELSSIINTMLTR